MLFVLLTVGKLIIWYQANNAKEVWGFDRDWIRTFLWFSTGKENRFLRLDQQDCLMTFSFLSSHTFGICFYSEDPSKIFNTVISMSIGSFLFKKIPPKEESETQCMKETVNLIKVLLYVNNMHLMFVFLVQIK